MIGVAGPFNIIIRILILLKWLFEEQLERETIDAIIDVKPPTHGHWFISAGNNAKIAFTSSLDLIICQLIDHNPHIHHLIAGNVNIVSKIRFITAVSRIGYFTSIFSFN